MYKYLVNLLFNWNSNRTKPNNAEQCELGDWWIPCPYRTYGEIHTYQYKYSYQSIKQNKYGKWLKELKWLGRHYPLSYYRKLEANKNKILNKELGKSL